MAGYVADFDGITPGKNEAATVFSDGCRCLDISGRQI